MLLIDLDMIKYYKYLEQKIFDNPLYIKHHPDITPYGLWISEQSTYTFKKSKHTEAMKLFNNAVTFNIQKIKLQLIKFLSSNCSCDIEIIKNIIIYSELANIYDHYYVKAFDINFLHNEWDKLNLEYKYKDEYGNQKIKNQKIAPYQDLDDIDEIYDLDLD